MNTNSRYIKIVEWSDEDQCYVGSCPGLFYGGCHGDHEQEVFSELCRIVARYYQTISTRLETPAFSAIRKILCQQDVEICLASCCT